MRKIISKKKPKTICKKKNSQFTQTELNLIKLSKNISKNVHNSNKKFIETWLKNNLETSFTKIIETQVKKELKNEVNPLILSQISKIESKIEQKVFKKLKVELIENLTDFLKILQAMEG